MKRLLFAVVTLLFCSALNAQQNDVNSTQREDILKQSRYLKSIYRIDEAIDLLSQLVNEERMDEEVMAELADCHYQNGDMETASASYFMLSSMFPKNILYKVRKMQLSYRMEDYFTAAQEGKAILVLDSIPSVISLIGDSYNKMQSGDSALAYYTKALAFSPMNVSLVNKASKVLLAQKRYDETIALADSYLQNDPDNRTIAPVKGIACFLSDQFIKAIEVFEAQKKAGNESYPVHFYLGQSYWHAKLYKNADDELKAAWQIDSSDVHLAFAIASVLRERGLDPTSWLDKAMEMIQPDKGMVAMINQQYGTWYLMNEEFKESIPYYIATYENNPKQISALQSVGYAYERMKDYKKAIEWYERYLKVGRKGSAGYKFVEEGIQHCKEELFMLEK